MGTCGLTLSASVSELGLWSRIVLWLDVFLGGGRGGGGGTVKDLSTDFS